MLKYLTVILLAVTPALSAFGLAPEQSARAHSAAPHHTRSTHALTAAQRRARAVRLEHERVVKRLAQEEQLSKHSATRHAAVAHRTVKHRVVRRHVAMHKTLAQRKAAHRAYERTVAAHGAYERHLAHERWLKRHRAYEARLKRRRESGHRAAEQAKAAKVKAVNDHPADTEVAKADAPKEGPRPETGTVHAASLDYVSHANVHLYWRSPLRGTHASLVRQGRRDREEGLTRIENEHELLELVRGHSLVPLPLNDDLQADQRLARDRRYTRPWTADFLRDLGRAYMHRFGEALVITSAVRPATYQRKLTWRNGNAAPANGAIASPHEYGATIDIGKKGMTAKEKAWMRGYLLPVQKAGQIDVEEEFYQACFHVTVYKNYVPEPMVRPQPEVADVQMDADAR